MHWRRLLALPAWLQVSAALALAALPYLLCVPVAELLWLAGAGHLRLFVLAALCALCGLPAGMLAGVWAWAVGLLALATELALGEDGRWSDFAALLVVVGVPASLYFATAYAGSCVAARMAEQREAA